MSFFTVSKDAKVLESTNSGSGGSNIFEGGMYDVILKAVWVEVNPQGARTINMKVNYNGSDVYIFQAIRLDMNNGAPHFQADIFNNLMIVLGIDNPTEPTEMNVVIGKNTKKVPVLTYLTDLPVTLRIIMSYSNYQGNIKENKVITNVFRTEDKACATEVVNTELEKGAQFDKEVEKGFKNVYRDGTNEAIVTAWKKRQASGNKDSAPSMTSAQSDNVFDLD